MALPINCPFHLAIPIDDLEAARYFYIDILGCALGREDPGRWLDVNFGGHQLSLHVKPKACAEVTTNAVDGDAVPVRHFGLVLPISAWRQLADRLQQAGTTFIIEPKIRFADQVGEQATMFLRDPAGNALEFKSFGQAEQLFETSR